MIYDRSFDKFDTYKILETFPDQFKVGLHIAKDIEIRGNFRNVIICGMGGSALSGDILKSYMPGLEIPVFISRDYYLPLQANEHSLIIFITYSGNTEETVSAFKQALHNHYRVACITSGGKLKDLCYSNGIPVALIPRDVPNFQPRYALGYMFAALMRILSNSGLIPSRDEEIRQMTANLKQFNFHEHSKKIAIRLYKKIPVIYSSDENKVIARIWKIKLNETSKTMAFYNYFPELNHNEITGHTESRTQGNFHSILLRDKSDHPRIKKRMDIFAEIIKSRGQEYSAVDLMDSEDRLTKIFSAILFGDWIAYYLAGEYRIDPTPMELVDQLKEKLKD